MDGKKTPLFMEGISSGIEVISVSNLTLRVHPRHLLVNFGIPVDERDDPYIQQDNLHVRDTYRETSELTFQGIRKR